MNSESSPGFFLVTIQELEEDCLGPLENISKGKLCDEVLERTDRGTMPNPIRSLGGHRHLFARGNQFILILVEFLLVSF